MRNLILALSALLFLAVVQAATAETSASSTKRVALVVGNDTYASIPALSNARSDARAVADALKAAGFEVTLAVDLDQRAFKHALRRFKGTLTGGEDAVFFYAGHAVEFAGSNYLLPIDAVHGDTEDDLRDDAIRLQRVLDDLRDQRARFSIVIVDACRDNPFKSRGRALPGRGLAPSTPATGQMVVYSAGAGQSAIDSLGPKDGDGHGLFTRVLLKKMAMQGLAIDQMMRQVRDEVADLADSVHHEQVPAVYEQTRGVFYFHPPPGDQSMARVARAGEASPSAQARAAGGPYPAPTAGAPPAAVSTGTAAAAGQKAVGKGFEVRPAAPGTAPRMIVINSGSYLMGAEPGDGARSDSEEPRHAVEIAQAFEIGQFEVTRGEYAAFVAATRHESTRICRIHEGQDVQVDSDRTWRDPGFPQTDEDPVVCVNWQDAKAYAAWISSKTGKTFRLPTEPEWEFAARGGNERSRPWRGGPRFACDHANIADQTAKARFESWYVHPCEDGYVFTAPVGSKIPLPSGLYDMIGNAREWIEDCWHSNYDGAPAVGIAWTSGGECDKRVVRGGGWSDRPQVARLSARNRVVAAVGADDLGFRLARSLARPETRGR